MSSEEYDIWGMPIRPSAPAAEEDIVAPAENASASESPFAPPPVEEALPEPAPEPVAATVAPVQVAVAQEEIDAALAAVNEIAAKGKTRPEAATVASSTQLKEVLPPAEDKPEKVEPETPVTVTPPPVVVAPVVEEPAAEAVAPIATRVPVAPVPASVAAPVVEAKAESAAIGEPETEKAAPAPVAATVVAPITAKPVPAEAEPLVVEAKPVVVEVKPVEPVAKESATESRTVPVAAVVTTAAVAEKATETATASAPIDVWGDAPKTAAAIAATAVVASAIADDTGAAATVAETPKPIANPLRRKRATRSSNDPVEPTPAQYVATPGTAPASTLTTSGAPDPRYAISGGTAVAASGSPYALTPSGAASTSSASSGAAPVAAPVSTPISTPIPPAATPMAATPVDAPSAFGDAPTPTPGVASPVAPPIVTPVTAAIPPGAMPVMVPTAAAAASVLSGSGVQVKRTEIYAPPVAALPLRQATEPKIEVINPEGWRRDFPMTKTILYVGSAPGADIVLPSSEVAPRHLQFVPSTTNKIGYRLINLGATPVAVQGVAGGEPKIAAARGSLELSEGDRVEIGGYGLVFHGGDVTSAQIQARLEVPNPRLTLDQPLEGALYIRNGGDKAGVQFVVEVQGIDSRFVQVESGPVLFPGMEKRVAFRISHPHTAAPAAGDQPINFVVTAPEGYPGETAIASQVITVAPFFAHKVRLIAIEPEMSGFSLSSGR